MSRLRPVMSLKEAAEYLGVSNDTLYTYAKKNLVPGFQIRKTWRFSKSVLDRWMELQSSGAKIPFTMSDEELALVVMRDALEAYRDPQNWDGAGGWINPRYATEISEVALEIFERLCPRLAVKASQPDESSVELKKRPLSIVAGGGR